MVHWFSKAIVHWLIRTEVIKTEDSDIYLFGVHQGIMSLINILTTLIIATILNMFLEGVLFIAVYKPLRSYAGGFHARTELRCYILSTFLSYTVLSVCKMVEPNLILLIVLLLAVLIIWILSPVEDSNKPLDKKEVAIYSKRCKCILLVEIFLMMLCFALSWYRIVRMMAIAIITLSVMVLLGDVRNTLIKRHFEGSAIDHNE